MPVNGILTDLYFFHAATDNVNPTPTVALNAFNTTTLVHTNLATFTPVAYDTHLAPDVDRWVHIVLNPTIAVTGGSTYMLIRQHYNGAYAQAPANATTLHQNVLTYVGGYVSSCGGGAYTAGAVCSNPYPTTLASGVPSHFYLDVAYVVQCGHLAYNATQKQCSSTACVSPYYAGSTACQMEAYTPTFHLFPPDITPNVTNATYAYPSSGSLVYAWYLRTTVTTKGNITAVSWYNAEAIGISRQIRYTAQPVETGCTTKWPDTYVTVTSTQWGWNTYTLPTPLFLNITHAASTDPSRCNTYTIWLTQWVANGQLYMGGTSNLGVYDTRGYPNAPGSFFTKLYYNDGNVSTTTSIWPLMDYTFVASPYCTSTSYRPSMVTNTTCVPVTCSSPYQRNTMSDDCDECASNTAYGTACTSTCPTCPSNSTCDAGYYGTGACLCNSGYRINTVTPSQCTPITCPSPTVRNTTDDFCDACPSGTYGGSCAPCPTIPANATCNDGYYGNGGFTCVPGYRVNTYTNTTCTPVNCTAPFARDAQDGCTQCLPGYYGSSCAVCPTPPAYAICNDGSAGNGSFTCITGYRVNTVTPTQCTPVNCPPPYERNTTTDGPFFHFHSHDPPPFFPDGTLTHIFSLSLSLVSRL